MSTGDLLQVYPSELKFSYELRKSSPCLMQLCNITSHYVAYKVKTTNPRNYCVRPNGGIILPGSTCDVTVLLQAPKHIIFDYNCKDKFLLQCVVAKHGSTFKDITDDMFTKEPGKVVEEFKFKVVYIPANSPSSPVPENSEEALSTLSSTSEIGSKNPLFDAPFFKNLDFKSMKDTNESSTVNKIIAEKDSQIQLHQKVLQQQVELLRKDVKRIRRGSFPAIFLVGLLGVIVGHLMSK